VFNIARQSKNIAEEIRIGNEALAEDPENLDYLFLLAFDLRSVELFGTPPNYSHGAQAADYSQRAIKLIEAGKVPNVVDKTKWNANQNLSMLYQNLAVIESNSKNTDKALEHYKKASSLDPTNSYNLLNCGSLYQQKYAAAAEKFGKLPEADRAAPDSKPEVKAILDEVNSYADAVIDCWARFLALTAKNNPYGAARDQVFKVTTDLYNFRHPGEPEGLQKLIDQYASTIQPPGGTASTSSPKP
jgi:tetratricopeptide (TPR) repeat protein